MCVHKINDRIFIFGLTNPLIVITVAKQCLKFANLIRFCESVQTKINLYILNDQKKINKEMNTFTQQGHFQLIKSDNKNIYNVIKDSS